MDTQREPLSEQEQVLSHFRAWSLLQDLKPLISAETYAAAERDLGMIEEVIAARPARQDQNRAAIDETPLPF